MKLEEEIQQYTFRNSHHKMIINLFYTYNVLSGKMQEFLRDSELTMQQFNILRILRGQHPNPATNGMVKERMLDKNSDVTRIIDRMVKNGLVQRVNCESDRRRVDITITHKGLEILAKLDKRAPEMDLIAEGVNDDEATQLNVLLDKLRSNTTL